MNLLDNSFRRSEDVVDINPGAMPQHSATPPSTGPSEPPRPPQQEDMHAALPLSISQQACRLGVSSPHGNRAGSQASSLARTPAALLQSDCGSQDDDLLVRWPSGASLTQGGARKAHQSADHDSALGSGSFIARELCRCVRVPAVALCCGPEIDPQRPCGSAV